MNKKLIGGMAALGVVAAVGTFLAPSAMAQGYHNWRDASAIRYDMRVIHGEDRRIAADRAALRHDYYSGNHYAAVRDRAALHHDLAVRGNARFNASVVHRHGWHHDW